MVLGGEPGAGWVGPPPALEAPQAFDRRGQWPRPGWPEPARRWLLRQGSLDGRRDGRAGGCCGCDDAKPREPQPRPARLAGLEVEESFERRTGSAPIGLAVTAIEDDEAGGPDPKIARVAGCALPAARPATRSLRTGTASAARIATCASAGGIRAQRLGAARIPAPGAELLGRTSRPATGRRRTRLRRRTGGLGRIARGAAAAWPASTRIVLHSVKCRTEPDAPARAAVVP